MGFMKGFMKNQPASFNNLDCQMQSIPKIQSDKRSLPSTNLPLLSRIRLFFRQHLALENRRKVKRFLHLSHVWQSQEVKDRKPLGQDQHRSAPLDLIAGDLVRVRTQEEILATLDSEGKLKGCAFIDVMWPYCGTTHRVFKPVHRFVDERNYKVRNTHGMVLLEGVMCEGTSFYGSCDRSCFFFWREEWLEKIER
jgi:hypothetical protein